MVRAALPHQAEALRWAWNRDQIALFWEMRVGKTLVAIRWSERKAVQKILVVCPADVMSTWMDELRYEGQRAEILQGYRSEPNRFFPFHITSYGTLRGNWALQAYPWRCIILDESRRISNPRSQISKICLKKFKATRYKAILTGEPAPESPLEYIPQMLFLNPQFLGCRNYYAVRAKHFTPDHMGWKWGPKPGVLSKLTVEVDQIASVLTRKVVDIGGKEFRERLELNLPTDLRNIYREAEEWFCLDGKETIWRPVVQTWLSRLAGGCYPGLEFDYKIKRLIRLLHEWKQQNIVIWCNYDSEIDAIQKAIEKSSLTGKAETIRGSVRLAERARINWRFQQHQIRYLICQTKCARHGRDFSAANTSVFFSVPWDLSSYRQARDRIIHPEKRESTLTMHLIGKETVDYDAYIGLLQKRNTAALFQSLIMKRMRGRTQ